VAEEPPVPVEQPVAEEPPVPVEQPVAEEPPVPVEQPVAEEPPVPVEQPAGPPPLPDPIDLREVTPERIRASVDAGAADVIQALVDQQVLSSRGPLTERDIRTMIFIALSSQDLENTLTAAHIESLVNAEGGTLPSLMHTTEAVGSRPLGARP
jgi:hypothetical protein